MIKKINAVISLFTVMLLAAHVTVMSLLLNGAAGFRPWFNTLAIVFIILLVFHVLISIIIMFFCDERASLLQYPALNIRTILQRGSAIILVIFLHTHFKHYTKTAADGSLIFVQPDIRIFLAEAVLIIAVVMHAAISVPKAFITLGIVNNDSSVRLITRISDIVGIILALFAVISLFMYCF